MARLRVSNDDGPSGLPTMLARFVADEWPAVDEKDRRPPYVRWVHARHAWAKANGHRFADLPGEPPRQRPRAVDDV